MQLQLTYAEQQMLASLFEEQYRAIVREIHHTDTFSFRQTLREKQKMLESLLQKIREAQAN
jgi:hypothetical protein